MTALIVIAIIIAVFAILFSIPISCRFYFRYHNEIEQDFSLKYGFIRIGGPKKDRQPDKKETVQKDKTDKKEKNKEDKKENKKAVSPKDIIAFVRENISAIKETIYAVLGYMFKRMVKINKLRIKLVLGVDDAMETALIFGAASAFIFNVIGVMDRKMRLKKHITEIKPAFDDPHIFAETEIKLSTSIGRIIMLAIIALRHSVPLLIKFMKINKAQIQERRINNGKPD
ncbi:MAG: DUF2953 domain-containing protein [Oscillospiraceae bacterium]|nr:DUF2953 domain-containing protein [Oscillospiraceae bacterium]